MGFFDKFFKSNKPKELLEGIQKKNIDIQEDINPDGQCEKVYFDLKTWKELTQEEREKRIVAYTIEETHEILIDLICNDKNGKAIDINLLRYGIDNKYSLKDLKKLILNILDSQNNSEIPIEYKTKVRNEFNEFIKNNNGKYSEEGKIILENDEEKPLTITRTFFINRKEYDISYQDRGDYGLINQLVDLCSDKQNLKIKKQRKYIDVETEVINVDFGNNSQKMKDILGGLYNLCILQNNLNNGRYLRAKNR